MSNIDNITVEPLPMDMIKDNHIIEQLTNGHLVHVDDEKTLPLAPKDNKKPFANAYTHVTPRMGNYYSLLLFPELTPEILRKRAQRFWELLEQYPPIKITPKNPHIPESSTEIYKLDHFSSINYELNQLEDYPSALNPQMFNAVAQNVLSLMNYGCQILINQRELQNALQTQQPLPLRSACLFIEPVISKAVNQLRYSNVNQDYQNDIQQRTIPMTEYQQIIKNLPGIEENLVDSYVFTCKNLSQVSGSGPNNYIRRFYFDYQHINLQQIDERKKVVNLILQSVWYTSLFSGYKSPTDFYSDDLIQGQLDQGLQCNFTQQVNVKNTKVTHSEPDFSQPIVHQQYPQNFQTLLMSTADSEDYHTINYPQLLRVDDAFYTFNSKAQLKQIPIAKPRKDPSNVLPQLLRS